MVGANEASSHGFWNHEVGIVRRTATTTIETSAPGQICGRRLKTGPPAPVENQATRRWAGCVRSAFDPRPIIEIGEEEEGLVGVELWAEVRRMHRLDGLSGREIGRRTGLAGDTVAGLLAASEPPRYVRAPAGSKLDPLEDWICEQLAVDRRIQSQRLRELAGEIGDEGGRW